MQFAVEDINDKHTRILDVLSASECKEGSLVIISKANAETTLPARADRPKNVDRLLAQRVSRIGTCLMECIESNLI